MSVTQFIKFEGLDGRKLIDAYNRYEINQQIFVQKLVAGVDEVVLGKSIMIFQ